MIQTIAASITGLLFLVVGAGASTGATRASKGDRAVPVSFAVFVWVVGAGLMCLGAAFLYAAWGQ